MKEKINFKEYLELSDKLEIKLGTITEVQRMEKSDKMLKLTVDFNDDDVRTVMTNIGNLKHLSGACDAETVLTNRQYPFVTNLEPVKMMGVVSEAMIVLPTNGDEPVIIGRAPNGSKLI